jgi:signal transduction histidine kinase/DNA-binding response OmpR family regulator
MPRPFRLVLLLFCLLPLGAAPLDGWKDPLAGVPALATYGTNNYKSSDSNWSMAVAPDGRVYVGNSAVMRFDGRSWVTIPIAGTYAVRALEPDAEGRLWVGAVDELGYIEDPAGSPRFVSLRPRLDPKLPLGAIWNIVRVGSRVVFIAEQRVLIWDGAAFHVREMPTQRRLFSFRYRGGVMVSQPGAGLWFTDGESFQPVDLGGAEKEEVGWGYELSPDASMFVTAKGLMRLDGGRATFVGGELDRFLRQGLTTGGVELPGGYFCIGTFRSGAVVIDRQGGICRVLDRRAGLPGQDIVSVGVGRDHLLCIVGRRFVTFLDSGMNVTTFGARNGAPLPSPRQVLLGGADRSFLVTDESLFKIGPSADGAHLTPLADGQFLDAINLPNGDVILGGLRQVAIWRPGQDLIVHREVNDVLRLAPLGSDRFVAAIGSSLRIGRSGPDGPEWETAEALFPEPIADLMIRGAEVWAVSERGNVHLLEAGNLTPLRTLRAGRELPANFSSPRFLRLGTRWLIRAGTEFYSLAAVEPVRLPELSGLSVIASERAGLSPRPDTWAVALEAENSGSSLLRLTESEGRVTGRAYPLASPAAIGRPIFLQRDQEGALWIVGTSGVLRYGATALDHLLLDRPKMLGATLKTASSGTVRLTLSSPWTLPSDFQSLTLDFRQEPEPMVTPVPMETRLVGSDTSWQTSLGEREFSRLRAGRYQFEVRLPGASTATTLATFVVEPPWYLKLWFGACVAVAALALIWLLVHLRLKQVAARNKALTLLVESQTNELTKAVAAKSAFIAQLGHEIRNPLNGVVGLATTLRGLPLPARESDMVVRLSSCADQLASVVEDVLEFSLVEAGKVQLKRRPFNLLDPAQSAIFVFESGSTIRPRLVTENIRDLERPRLGDPDRIRQILANYLENARKYAGGSNITVSVKEETETRVVMCVADQGPGIPAPEMPHIFERFSRGEDALRQGIPGTGLGLAACQAYASAMGGTVWVESKPGEGAKFYLALDLPLAHPGSEAPLAESRAALDGWLILVVDDHDYNLFVMSDILQKMGATTRTADSVASALRLFDTAIPDLIFIDVDLGADSGITLARQIRESHSSSQDVPIIATSGFGLDDVREGCLKAGMNGFISKPVTMEKVSVAVRQLESLAGNSLVSAEATPATRSRSNLDLLSDGDAGLRERVIASARQSLLASAEALAQAGERRELEGIRRHAHAITSAALAIDLAMVASLARETERCARRGATDDAIAAATVLLAAVNDSVTSQARR